RCWPPSSSSAAPAAAATRISGRRTEQGMAAARRLLRLAAAAVLLAGTGPAAGQEPPAPADPLERGRYLVHAGGCLTCHTAEAEDAVPLAGGHALETPFGTFHVPNITPDPETGIGDWTAEEFVEALRHGLSPGGSPY